MYWSDAAWWAWIPMTITMILFWALVAWVAFRLLAPRSEDERAPRTAREILDSRLASGEISGEEYDELRGVLEGEHREPAGSPSRVVRS
jgi:uncharacterized membrane protein